MIVEYFRNFPKEFIKMLKTLKMLRVLVIFLLIIGHVAADERLPSKCVICRINEKQLNKRRSVQRSTS